MQSVKSAPSETLVVCVANAEALLVSSRELEADILFQAELQVNLRFALPFELLVDAPIPPFTAREMLKKTGSNSSETHDDECFYCGGGGLLVCCSNCLFSAHLKCAGIDGKESIPDKWLCDSCREHSNQGKTWDDYCSVCGDGGKLLCCETATCTRVECEQCVDSKIQRFDDSQTFYCRFCMSRASSPPLPNSPIPPAPLDLASESLRNALKGQNFQKDEKGDQVFDYVSTLKTALGGKWKFAKNQDPQEGLRVAVLYDTGWAIGKIMGREKFNKKEQIEFKSNATFASSYPVKFQTYMQVWGFLSHFKLTEDESERELDITSAWDDGATAAGAWFLVEE